MEIGHFREHTPIRVLPGEALMSINRCQSVELRANRDTSRPSTIPARPKLTSVTSR
jgi:hypothetical protein